MRVDRTLVSNEYRIRIRMSKVKVRILFQQVPGDMHAYLSLSSIALELLWPYCGHASPQERTRSPGKGKVHIWLSLFCGIVCGAWC
jgi:hypothetical protein